MAMAAAAIVAQARRDIQHEFFSQDAVRTDRAIAFEPGRHAQRRVFQRLQRAGIIHEAPPGCYWLDVIACDVDMRRRHGRVRIALLGIVVLLLIGGSPGLLTLHRS